MRKTLMILVSLSMAWTLAGCDWVQNRIPDDYFDGDGTVAPGTPTAGEESNGGTQEGPEGSQTATDGQTEGSGGATNDAGGTSNGAGGIPTNPGGTGTVSFEIPQGWYWRDAEKRTAAKGNPATIPDYYVPEGKIVLWGITDGTDAEAKTAIQAAHAENQQTCTNEGAECTGQPRYMEIDMGAIKVYAAVGQPEYAEMRTTYAKFAKNGKVLSLTIYDDVANQMPLLEKVVTTVDW